MPVGLIATLKVKDGKQTTFESVFNEYQNTVRNKEPGNLFFHLHKSREDSCTYVVIEQYVDDAAVEAHRNSEHYKAIPGIFADFMAGPPDIQVLDSIP